MAGRLAVPEKRRFPFYSHQKLQVCSNLGLGIGMCIGPKIDLGSAECGYLQLWLTGTMLEANLSFRKWNFLGLSNTCDHNFQ